MILPIHVQFHLDELNSQWVNDISMERIAMNWEKTTAQKSEYNHNNLSLRRKFMWSCIVTFHMARKVMICKKQIEDKEISLQFQNQEVHCAIILSDMWEYCPTLISVQKWRRRFVLLSVEPRNVSCVWNPRSTTRKRVSGVVPVSITYLHAPVEERGLPLLSADYNITLILHSGATIPLV